MDELHLLRATRNTAETVPPAVLAAGRERLMKKAAEEERRSLALVATASDAGFGGSGGSHSSGGSGGAGHGGGRVLRPRRPWRRVLAASAAAAAIVASVVTFDVVGSGDSPATTASAAEVLNAAATTIEASDPVLAPGQYLSIDTKAVYTTATVAANGEEFAWLASQDHQLYVPADRTGEWVWVRQPTEPVQFFDEASRQEAERQAAEREAEGTLNEAEVWRAPAGQWRPYGEELGPVALGPKILGDMPLEEAIATAPRDPGALLELIYDYQRGQGKGDTPYEEAFTTIADTLREGVIVPADLRAALYKAAALIPGLTVVDEQATLDGRTGVSLGMQSSRYEARREIIVDPATGQMIGEREILLEDVEGIPAGTASAWTAVTTSVVDSAP